MGFVPSVLEQGQITMLERYAKCVAAQVAAESMPQKSYVIFALERAGINSTLLFHVPCVTGTVSSMQARSNSSST
jgi:hypothetical protein